MVALAAAEAVAMTKRPAGARGRDGGAAFKTEKKQNGQGGDERRKEGRKTNSRKGNADHRGSQPRSLVNGASPPRGCLTLETARVGDASSL